MWELAEVLYTFLTTPQLNMLNETEIIKLPNVNTCCFLYNEVLWGSSIENNKVLQKSIDGGVTWNPVYTFAVDITIIIVCENGNILVQQDINPSIIYLSTDNGNSFSPTLTLAEGKIELFAFDVEGNTVFVNDYGVYGGRYTYRSTDAGVTWSIAFTHPYPTVQGDAGRQHMHTVHIDRHTKGLVYITSGDRVSASGIWFSFDMGNTWNVIVLGHAYVYKPIALETDDNYLYMFEDGHSRIMRVNKIGMLSGNSKIEHIYDVATDTLVDINEIAYFHACRLLSNGLILAATEAYGSTFDANSKEAALFVGWQNGDYWTPIIKYEAKTYANGVAYITREDSNGYVYIFAINDTEEYPRPYPNQFKGGVYKLHKDALGIGLAIKNKTKSHLTIKTS